MMYCQACQDSEYSLQHSEVLIDQTDGLTIDDITSAKCLTCPYGGSCSTDVHSKANFWGTAYGHEIYMYLCPDGYCCPNNTCKSYQACAPDREGRLCGRCKQGFSESLFDTSCIPDAKCSYASAFWAVIAVYGLLYGKYLILFLLDFLLKCFKHPQLSCCRNKSDFKNNNKLTI